MSSSVFETHIKTKPIGHLSSGAAVGFGRTYVSFERRNKTSDKTRTTAMATTTRT
jgi:hypothetical protein